jgi:hypothetical protein
MKAEDWQPISSAPRDGTVILVCNATGYTQGVPVEYAIAMFEDGEWYDEWGIDTLDPLTHWMPLVAPG